MSPESYNETALSPTLSLNLSLSASEDESVADDDSYQSLNSKGRDTRYQDQETSRLNIEIETLLTKKLDLADKLVELSDQVVLKETRSSQLDQDLVRQQSDLQEEIEKQERKRDELEHEVDQMKLRIHLLSSDLKDDSSGQHNFSSILRSLSADHSEDSQGEVEMRTIRDVPQMSNGMNARITMERLAHLENIEKELNEEKTRGSQLETRCQSLEQEIESIVVEKERLAHLESVEQGLIAEKAQRSQLETRCQSLEKEVKSIAIAQEQLAHLESVEKELTEEKGRRSKLETRCQSLEQEINCIAIGKEQFSAAIKQEQDAEKWQASQLETKFQTIEQEAKSIASDEERLAHHESVEKGLPNEEKAQQGQLETRSQSPLEQEHESIVLEAKELLDSLESVETHLTGEKDRKSQLETRCQSLEHELKSIAQEKGELSLQNETLLAEVQSLKSEMDSIREVASDTDSNEEPSEAEKSESLNEQKRGYLIVPTVSGDKQQLNTANTNKENAHASATAEREKIRSHAEQMLSWAEKAIERRGSSRSVCSSVGSSIGTEFKPVPVQPAPVRGQLNVGKPPKMPPKPRVQVDQQQIVISNLGKMDTIVGCTCETSAFSGNSEHTEFYLPKLGVACSCGKKKEPEPAEGSNPCALDNILRQWQVDFLASIGVKDAVEFVHAYNNRGYALAKEMRRWRRGKNMVSVKTKSCNIALHIWSRTCKSVVKAVQVQKANGVKRPRRPDFMDITLSSDNGSVSTMGLGSVNNFDSASEVEL